MVRQGMARCRYYDYDNSNDTKLSTQRILSFEKRRSKKRCQSDCTLNIFLFLIDKRIMFKYNMMIQCSKNKSCISRWFSLPFSVICCSFVCLLVCF